jgi:Spy/CpxP family protein refolding chaperone
MRSNLICSLLLGLSISVMTGTETLAQAPAKSKDTAKVPATKTSEPAKAAAEFRRVPQYFGQVDLSDEQREKLYSIREKNSKKLDQLEAELVALRATILSDSEAVLTPAQRTILNKLRGEAKAKASAKSKAAKKN